MIAGWPEDWEKNAQILDIEAKTIVPNQKRLNYIIQQSLKNLHQTPSKLLKIPTTTISLP